MNTSPQKLDAEVISAALSVEYGHPVAASDISSLGDVAFKTEVADATSKFWVPAPDGGSGFLLVSAAGNPRLVERAAHNIQTVRDATSPDIARAILSPVTTGDLGGYTFAVWPRHRPFETSNRLTRLMRRRRYANLVIGWNERLVRETLKPADPQVFANNLQAVTEEPNFPDDMRHAARSSTERITSKIWKPQHCIQHGDFWSGNILLPNNTEDPPFYIIDWAGMQHEGYPFIDMSRMLMSLKCSPKVSARHLDGLRRHIACETQDMVAYVLSSIGHTGQNLEHFPVERYRKMAIRVFQFINKF